MDRDASDRLRPAATADDWNDCAQPARRPVERQRAMWGPPVDAAAGDWVGLLEAAEALEVSIDEVLSCVGMHRVRWRLIEVDEQAELQFWLPDLQAQLTDT